MRLIFIFKLFPYKPLKEKKKKNKKKKKFVKAAGDDADHLFASYSKRSKKKV